MSRTFFGDMHDSALTYVRNGDVSLTCEHAGTGPRHVVMAHGWISARRMWYDVAAQLDPAAFTLHLMDFRGCGLSDRPREGHDIEGYASDLRAIVHHAGPCTLVGHSMGGKLAQYVACTGEPAIRRMILVAPGTARASRFPQQHRTAAVEAFGNRIRIERFARAAMSTPVSPQQMERLVNDALVAQYEHWIGWYDRGRAVDFSERLGGIRVPALVIAGGNDPLAPATRVKRDVVDAIAGAVSVVLRQAGHNLPLEAPADIASAVRRFAE